MSWMLSLLGIKLNAFSSSEESGCMCGMGRLGVAAISTVSSRDSC